MNLEVGIRSGFRTRIEDSLHSGFFCFLSKFARPFSFHKYNSRQL